VSVSVGCNNTCTFCIVPSLRGKEKDRRPGEILAEIRALVDEGVSEVTLLGQNVNAYGVEFGDRHAFSQLLRACGEVDGLERVRFTSPHPAEFSDDVIAAMAETPNVMHQLHMPLQSGSDRVLKAMRRSYRREKYLGIIERVRDAMPDAALSTDIIVGFPGETEDDFAQTLEVVREARFAAAFTFQYSIRPGTPAATMPDLLAGEPAVARHAGRAARRRGGGPQGRRHPPAHRPGPRQPPGPLRCAGRAGRDHPSDPARRPRRGGDLLRRPAPPRGRRPGARPSPYPVGGRLGGADGASTHRRRAGHACRRYAAAAGADGLRLNSRTSENAEQSAATPVSGGDFFRVFRTRPTPGLSQPLLRGSFDG
jgi:tRNA-2-methylthio-N6-dimethylallyladenosine synthase